MFIALSIRYSFIRFLSRDDAPDNQVKEKASGLRGTNKVNEEWEWEIPDLDFSYVLTYIPFMYEGVLLPSHMLSFQKGCPSKKVVPWKKG